MNKTIYQERRNALAKLIYTKTGGGIAVISTAPELARNRDSEFPYRHDSDFFYLTGFEEPGASLVIEVKGGDKTHQVQSHLFCRPKDPEREIWDGIRLGPEAAPTTLGIEYAHSNQELDHKLGELLANQDAIYIRLAESAEADRRLRHWMKQVRGQGRSGINPPSEFHDVEALIHEMRLFKDEHEIDIMRRAAAISARAHIRAMQICRPGMREYQLEAELLHEFRNSGAQSVAYNSIVAGGANSCILHYRAGSTELRNGELCLIDAGCELDGYASDITRTFPVNGKFTGPQRALYDITLAAQEAAIAMARPGNTFMQPHEAALTVLTQGLLDENLLKLSELGSLENAIETGAYRRFYMHRTSHWLGMDVHDVGSYREHTENSLQEEKPWRILKRDMVITIEPGLYIRPADDIDAAFWNIGIRIEDDAVINDSGCELISRGVPVNADEIEAIMKNA
ncbi:aminopeptidase P N-terminal domain-containing protein [Polynucleobacter sp. MG-5-Ahmo-C2]|jgi:Xaa-Pro aminopeptidase|uniref:aminopeptidase P N-terminal domain-containing protein n=1 Tax=Polynucleobacter sp. MG-5-Ahmo-C2 TaxID=2081051 RepID=UPI001BFE08C5|nr:aminopeptidase P N-terminal domain-containing protein [Polynucleobacter sp. MG-5-Ahmo-C2]QWD98330.1 aminopeptidase P N-terminal domain-containing protein [Polynucleobacter sp. MG-5-Ahmo-C2]